MSLRMTFWLSVVLRMFFSVGLCTKKLLNTSLVFSLVFLVWCLEFLSKILVTRCQGGRNGARDPLRRTECQKALVARREPAKLGTGSLFLVAEDCSKVKGTYDSGGRWREYLPSLEGIQEDCRIWGQRSKGRGGLSVTQLFWETKRKKKKRSWMVIPGVVSRWRIFQSGGVKEAQSYLRHQTTYILTDPQIDINDAIYV